MNGSYRVPAVESIGAAACVSCGGVVAWNAARQQLACRSCGTAAAEAASPAGAVEHFPLLPRLADRPDSGRDWQPRATHLRCRSCQAIMAYDEHVVGRVCDACGTPALVPSDATGAPVFPSGVLPFRLSEADARTRLTDWLKAKRGRFTAINTVRGVYLPCWVFNARVSCRWRGERRRTRDGEEERTAIDGIVERTFDDYLIPASTTIDSELLAKVDPFPVADMRGYDARYLAGFTTEIYSRNMWEAWDAASARMEAGLQSDLRHDSKCEPYELETWPEWRDQRCALVLVPAYAITYRHQNQEYQGVVNGWTGETAAAYSFDWKWFDYIILAILLGIVGAVLYLIYWLLTF
jgi:predicted RNA-binding Zn-ribbon protein involved in translation (DUF1610 family)